ncbi:MAG: glutathione S-transferase, partial [Gammaproteobacteria bacterium]|nr:glutathione S-transferase [Gammaproteobacteria bacterium]
MSEELVLYASPLSRGRIAHWMLEETGVSYRYEVVNL